MSASTLLYRCYQVGGRLLLCCNVVDVCSAHYNAGTTAGVFRCYPAAAGVCVVPSGSSMLRQARWCLAVLLLPTCATTGLSCVHHAGDCVKLCL